MDDINFSDTFSPVPNLLYIGIVHKQCHLLQLDIKNVFLNGELS